MHFGCVCFEKMLAFLKNQPLLLAVGNTVEYSIQTGMTSELTNLNAGFCLYRDRPSYVSNNAL